LRKIAWRVALVSLSTWARSISSRRGQDSASWTREVSVRR